MGRLDSKVALITGGSRGIGFAIAKAFAKEGAAVALSGRSSGASLSTAAQILSEEGAEVVGFAADVSEEPAVKQMVGAVLAEFGRIDVLVNSAGISQRKPFTEITVEDWDRVFSINLRGLFLVTRQVVPAMLAQGDGRIINIASQMGQRGGALLTHYSASKAGVIGFTKALAREMAPTIRVNAIAPGPVLTDMVRGREQSWFDQIQAELPLGRLALPEEVAGTAVFLASDDGILYTGQTLGPNCGHVML